MEYKNADEFDNKRIPKINDIQFFDRNIGGKVKPAMMIEYRNGRVLYPLTFPRELYEFDTPEERRKFYKQILKKYR